MTKLLQQVATRLTDKSLRIATAESTAGGYLGHLLNLLPGSSKYFTGGVIAYTSQAKTDLLGVPGGTIKENGSVSAQTVLAMAEGARKILKTDIAIAESGTAGPTGGTPAKPAGTVFIAIDTADGYQLAERCYWDTDRIGFKQSTATAALKMVLAYLSR